MAPVAPSGERYLWHFEINEPSRRGRISASVIQAYNESNASPAEIIETSMKRKTASKVESPFSSKQAAS